MTEQHVLPQVSVEGGESWIRGWTLALGAFLGVGIVACGALFVSGLRERARSTTCSGNIYALGMGMFAYQEKHAQLPPAHIDSATGERMHSWRILITEGWLLPSPSPYAFDQPWDSDHNIQVGSHRPESYACPSDREAQRGGRLTNYFVVEGVNTPFASSRATTLNPLADRQGHANTILIVEAHGLNIQWLEPRDLVSEGMSFVINDKSRPSVSSAHLSGPHACMADGSVRSLKGINPEVLRAMTRCDVNQASD